MKFYNVVGVIALGLLVSCSYGCSRHDTHGTEKDIRVTANFNTGGGNITITSPLTLDSTSDTKQDTAGTSTISPPIRLQLTEGGSTAGGDSSPMSDIRSRLENTLDSGNTTTTTTSTVTTNYKENEDNVVKGEDPVEEVSQGKEEVSEDLDWKNKATYTSYGKRNGDRYAWRIPKKGPEFGEPIKLVFSSGKTYLVKDTDKNCRGADPENCDLSSDQNRDGFVFKPGIGPNGDGDTNTGTSHAGVYLQGPYGDPSTSVTIYYNKP